MCARALWLFLLASLTFFVSLMTHAVLPRGPSQTPHLKVAHAPVSLTPRTPVLLCFLHQLNVFLFVSCQSSQPPVKREVHEDRGLCGFYLVAVVSIEDVPHVSSEWTVDPFCTCGSSYNWLSQEWVPSSGAASHCWANGLGGGLAWESCWQADPIRPCCETRGGTLQ